MKSEIDFDIEDWVKIRGEERSDVGFIHNLGPRRELNNGYQ